MATRGFLTKICCGFLALVALLPIHALGQAQTYFDTHASIVGPISNGRFGAAIDCSDGSASSHVSLIAVGAPDASNGEGRVYVYSVADTPTLLITLQAPSPAQNYHFGSAVAFIPDFNADGKEDLLIGEASDPLIRDPRIYVYQSGGQPSFSYCHYASNSGSSFGSVIHGYRLFGAQSSRFIAGIPTDASAIPYGISAAGPSCATFSLQPRSGQPGFGASITEVPGDFDLDSEVDTIIGAPLYTGNSGAVNLSGSGSIGIYLGAIGDEAGTAVAGHRSSLFYALSSPKSSSGAGEVIVRDLNFSTPGLSCSVARSGTGTSVDFGKALKHLHQPAFNNIFTLSSAVWAAYRSESSTGGSVAIFNTDGSTCSSEYQYNNCIADPNQEQGSVLAGGSSCTGHLSGSVKSALIVGSPGYNSGTGRIDIVAEGSDHSSPTICSGGGGSTPVSPGTDNLPAPSVSVSGKSATVTAPTALPTLSQAQRKKYSKLLQRKAGLSKSKADQALNNLSVQYIFTVKAGFGSFSEAAVSSDDLSAQASSFTRRSKRNSVTFSRLPPGAATASYRVEIATRKPAFVLGQTKPSRSAQFTVP